ncbi:M12 family metallopeptidase [Archangium lansingense]|uniref:M12 family metallopeptidase n=1 Tax=Archangium lansingense TaxID=2995310 RepID=UPI003B79E717
MARRTRAHRRTTGRGGTGRGSPRDTPGGACRNRLQANTNLRFRQRTNEGDFVTFQDGAGCSSTTGRRGGEQFITIGNGCDWPRVVHEICHAAGLWHEQSREDRDNFVTIHWDNISEANRHNFNQHITDGDDVGSYDYGSIMHYGRRGFAVDPTKDTITPTDPAANIGQRTGLSAGDIAALNILYPKTVVLGDTSTNAPAIVWRDQQFLLGWTGHGNNFLNFLNSADGVNFGGKVTLGDTSPEEFALVSFKNKFVVAWIGTGGNQLNIMQSSDGRNWGNKVTLGDASKSGPALAVFNNQLYLAWRGHGNNKLNVMRSSDGVGWGNKVTLSDTSTSGPALAVLNTRLLLAWRGEGNNQLNVMSSTDGSNFGNKVTLNETTLSQPHLHSRGGRAFLSWQGQSNNRLNVLVSTNGSQWGSKVTMNDTCTDGPVLTSTPSNLICAWTGTDASHHLNTMRLNIV